MAGTVIADTGPLYALIDSSDAWHERVVTWWNARARNVIVPVSVLPEVSYLLQTRIGPAAEQVFIQRDVLTTDRQHFGVVKPVHARSLVLLP